VLFVMTADSVQDHSVTKSEWVWALKYKKPVIPLRVVTSAAATRTAGASSAPASARTRIAGVPFSAKSIAALDEKAAGPVARPGLAPCPLASNRFVMTCS
jgi:hypothetical protein